MTHYVVTANDLHDGAVVWLRDEDGRVRWTSDSAAASATDAPDRRDAWLAAAEMDVLGNRVVGVYAVEVNATGDGFAHTSVRERVRAAGPTVGPAAR